MHTVAGATSIAGLKKWAAQQQPSAEGVAPHQYVAVASDACNIEFDFLGRAARSNAPSWQRQSRLEAPLSRWRKAASRLRSRATAVLGPAAVPCSLSRAPPKPLNLLRLTLQARCRRAGTPSCPASETSRGARASKGCWLGLDGGGGVGVRGVIP